MLKKSRIALVGTVATCVFCGAVSSALSGEVKKSTKNEAFAMRFDKTYEAFLERLQAALLQNLRGPTIDRIDYRELLTEAKRLAEHAGPEAHLYLKSEVEDQVARRGKFAGRMPRFDLALLTLAKLESDDARDTLRDFLYREETGRSTVIVISYLPQQRTKGFLEDVLQTPDRITEPIALQWTVSLLAAIGDKKSMTVLKSLDGKEKRLPPDFLTKQHEIMQNRLAIKSEKERSERTKNELLYWQTKHDLFRHRVMTTPYYVAARRLHERNLKLPVDLLLSKLPDPMAIAILAAQKEAAAIPELEKLTTRDGVIGPMAKKALEAIRKTPTP